MTPRERRGKRLFLVLATLLILKRLAGVGMAFGGGLAEVQWLRSVAQPLGFALAIALLWRGETWLRWLVAVTCVFSGGLLLFVSGRVLVALAGATPPDAAGFFLEVGGLPIGLLGLSGLLDVVAGLLFLLSPSLRAFFRRQREGPRAWIQPHEPLGGFAGQAAPTDRPGQ